jgi:hypothetical protein
MRNSDQHKEVRSYVVAKNHRNQLVVKGESWLPGYTSAHKATPEEAIAYEIDKAYSERDRLLDRIDDLNELSDKNEE